MIKRNFLIVVLLFFFKILFIQSAQKEVKIGYIDYDFNNKREWVNPKNKTNLKIKDKKIIKKEVIDLLKITTYNFHKNLPDNFNTDYKLYLIKFVKLDDNYKVLDEFYVLSGDEAEIILDDDKYSKIDKDYSVEFIFLTNSAIDNIKNSKISRVKVNKTILDLKKKINICNYLNFLSNGKITSIYEEITKQNLISKISLEEASFGKAFLNIPFNEYLKNIDEKSLSSCKIKNNDKDYNLYSDNSEDLIFEFNCKIKRNVNINIVTPNGYILDVDCPNSFKLDLYLNDFSVKGILESLRNSLKEYFGNLIKIKRDADENFRATCDIDSLSYGFNAIDEPIDPKKYTLKNTTNTLEITKNDDIKDNIIFNLTDNSTIEIEVGENCELLKTMIAEIKFIPLEKTEVNSKIAKNWYKILLNLKDPSPENLKKQIIDYLKSKKIEGYYIPENFYEQILNTDGFYKKCTHDHFELSINFNQNAMGNFIKPVNAPDPDLEYFKNYKEEDGKPINPPKYIPPQYIPPVQEQNVTPKLDKNTMCCAQCCNKCIKCSNCKKEPAR